MPVRPIPLTAGARRHKQALEEVSSINAQKNAQIERLSMALTTRGGRSRHTAGDAADTEVAMRSEIEALRSKSSEQALLIDRLQRRQGALVPLHGDDAPRAQCQQGTRQPAGTGADLDNRRILQRSRGARDSRREVEVKQEILTERLACRQRMLTNDLAKRRKVVDRAHAGCAAAMRAASRNAAIRLDGSARPEPAISKAVP